MGRGRAANVAARALLETVMNPPATSAQSVPALGTSPVESHAGQGDLRITPLHGLHCELHARMVPFAGFSMPVQYPTGIIHEHLQTRESAGLFDVSHMGQAWLHGKNAGRALEALVCGDMQGLELGRQRYTLLLNGQGGIIDDLMVARHADRDGEQWFFLVVNASRKEIDFAHITAGLGHNAELSPLDDRALLALQGPRAAQILAREIPQIFSMSFMQSAIIAHALGDFIVSRSGYTGEDGFEISVPNHQAESFARLLLAHEEVAPVGLGARDSLRLEAGLCLYGHDIDETTSPVEAGLQFALSKRRLEAGDFPGAARIIAELSDGPARKRIGFSVDGRQPVRDGEAILIADEGVGHVTSGGYGPSVKNPIGMGYVKAGVTETGDQIEFLVRNKRIAATVTALPFVKTNYQRQKK